jgi:glutamine amidotransferase
VELVMPKIVILNYGLGNLRNVQRGLEAAGSKAWITTERSGVEAADAIILPGVGAFRDAIANLVPFKQKLQDQVESGVPLLGICLGLQLLYTQSTEGGWYPGLDVLKGTILALPKGRKIPQIGWNTLKIVDAENPLVYDVPDDAYAYFVHSYYAQVDDEMDVVTTTRYGIDFPSIVARKNVFATQFHPEKSGKTGLKILKNFVAYVKR